MVIRGGADYPRTRVGRAQSRSDPATPQVRAGSPVICKSVGSAYEAGRGCSERSRDELQTDSLHTPTTAAPSTIDSRITLQVATDVTAAGVVGSEGGLGDL
jgi:hypothetical protein